MTDVDQLRRLAIAGAALAILVGMVSTGLVLAAFDWDFNALTFGDPQTILTGGPQAAILWRWGMLGDMFYSYLLLLPLALFIHRRLRDRRPWLADLGLSGALSYIFLGGASAAIIAIAGSSLIETYAVAAPDERSFVAGDFRLLRDIFYFGVWQTLDAITAGLWALSTGWLLLRDRPVLGRLLVALGVAFWAGGVMTMLGVHSLAVLAAIFGTALAAWVVWVALTRPRAGSTWNAHA